MAYYVRHLLRKKSAPQWKVQYVSYKKSDQREGISAEMPKRTWDIPKDRWRVLGFHHWMSLREAQARTRQLNAQLQLKRQEECLKKARERERDFRLRHEASLPDEFVCEFEARFVLPRGILSPEQRRRCTKRRYTIWHAAERMITTLGIDPSEWFYHINEIYDYFVERRLSLGYVQAILNMANLWGYFISRMLCKPFLPVPRPRGYERQRFIESFYQKESLRRGPSQPITPDHIMNLKDKLNSKNLNWLHVSAWFGLRPQEIDSLKQPCRWKVEILPTGRKVLWVYQTKIIALPPEDRWKPIPVVCDEQNFALKIIQDGNHKRPLLKTIHQHLGREYGLYGGRKGFVDLMLSKGHSIENISIWMGHSSLDRTWRSYKNKRVWHLD